MTFQHLCLLRTFPINEIRWSVRKIIRHKLSSCRFVLHHSLSLSNTYTEMVLESQHWTSDPSQCESTPSARSWLVQYLPKYPQEWDPLLSIASEKSFTFISLAVCLLWVCAVQSFMFLRQTWNWWLDLQVTCHFLSSYLADLQCKQTLLATYAYQRYQQSPLRSIFIIYTRLVNGHMWQYKMRPCFFGQQRKTAKLRNVKLHESEDSSLLNLH